MVEMEINQTLYFLGGQLELYKIEFAETDNNKYLQVMNKLNDSIELINKLKKVAIGTTKELYMTKRELEKIKKLSEENDALRYFDYKGVKYELTGSYHTKNGKLMHQIKNTKTGTYKRVKTLDGSIGDIIPTSDADLQRILNQ